MHVFKVNTRAGGETRGGLTFPTGLFYDWRQQAAERRHHFLGGRRLIREGNQMDGEKGFCVTCCRVCAAAASIVLLFFTVGPTEYKQRGRRVEKWRETQTGVASNAPARHRKVFSLGFLIISCANNNIMNL